jgi:hypothetical protein
MENKHAPLSNVQLELLKLFASDVPEEDLKTIKRILLRFKAERLMDMADQVWEEQAWDDQKIEEVLQSHLRTPYQHPRVVAANSGR